MHWYHGSKSIQWLGSACGVVGAATRYTKGILRWLPTCVFKSSKVIDPTHIDNLIPSGHRYCRGITEEEAKHGVGRYDVSFHRPASAM